MTKPQAIRKIFASPVRSSSPDENKANVLKLPRVVFADTVQESSKRKCPLTKPSSIQKKKAYSTPQRRGSRRRPRTSDFDINNMILPLSLPGFKIPERKVREIHTPEWRASSEPIPCSSNCCSSQACKGWGQGEETIRNGCRQSRNTNRIDGRVLDFSSEEETDDETYAKRHWEGEVLEKRRYGIKDELVYRSPQPLYRGSRLPLDFVERAQAAFELWRSPSSSAALNSAFRKHRNSAITITRKLQAVKVGASLQWEVVNKADNKNTSSSRRNIICLRMINH